MNAYAMRWSFRAPVGPMSKFVMMVLAAHANRELQAWPSNRVLADATGLSVRHVRRCLGELRASGFVSPEYRRGRSTVWTFHNPYRVRTPVSGTPDIYDQNPGHPCPPEVLRSVKEGRAESSTYPQVAEDSFLSGTGWVRDHTRRRRRRSNS